jgi:hypothetical protein
VALLAVVHILSNSSALFTSFVTALVKCHVMLPFLSRQQRGLWANLSVSWNHLA